MDLTKIASTLLSSDSIDGLSELTGSSGSDVSNVLAQALPVLLSGANNQAKDKNTAKSFASALSDHAKADTNNLTKFLGNVDIEDGAKIIGHLLGSGKEDTVKKIAKDSGVSKSQAGTIIDAAAPLLMSLLGQQADEDENKDSGVGDLIGVLLDNVDVGSLLTNLLTDNSSSDKKTTKKTTKKSSSTKSTAKKTSSTKKTTKKASSSTKKSTAKKTTKKSTKKSDDSNDTAELVTSLLKNILT